MLHALQQHSLMLIAAFADALYIAATSCNSLQLLLHSLTVLLFQTQDHARKLLLH